MSSLRDASKTPLRRRLHALERSPSTPNHDSEMNLANGHGKKDPLDQHLFSPETARTSIDIPLSPVDVDDASDSDSSGDAGYDVPSSVGDDDQDEHDGARVESPQPMRSNTSLPSRSREPPASTRTSWYEFDLSVVVALISPIGNWLTGGDHVKNLLLILFLIFYLHQIIELPWALYNQSRPRRTPRSSSSAAEDRYNKIAISELRSLEMFFLTCTVLSPFIGALILRWASSLITGQDVISWFSTGLFVLATGIRPWKHLIDRLQQRTLDLHDAIHYPQAENDVEETRENLEEMMNRVERLEDALAHVQGRVAVVKEEVYDYVDDVMEGVEKVIRKHEKKCDASSAAQELHLAGVTQSVDNLKKGTDALLKSGGHFPLQRSQTMEWALSFFSDTTVKSSSPPPTIRPKSPSISKLQRFPSSPRLETIPEDSDFRVGDPSFKSKPAPLVRIPGFNLVLRIGDLATLPMRAVVDYLLSRKRYSSRLATSP